jgi:2-C-methyl-D-erythritol 4-phosphate cytidylyltransferase
MLLEGDYLVAIHDGARPLVSPELIHALYAAAAICGSAVPAIQPADAVRLMAGDQSRPIGKEKVRLIQTPQCFRLSSLKRAYTAGAAGFPDDAELIETSGETIHLVAGEHTNIKVTYADDLLIAAALLRQRERAQPAV